MTKLPPDPDNWETAVEEFCSRFQRRLATGEEYEHEFVQLLARTDSPIAKLEVRAQDVDKPLVAPQPHRSIPADATPPNRWTFALATTTWTVEAWRSTAPTTATFDESQARRLLDCFWKSEQRDHKSGLVALDRPHTPALLDQYLNTLAESQSSVACFYVDLDRFGEVNEKCGHQVADRVIFDWSNMVEDLLRRRCVVLHRSGDEFLIFFPNATSSTVLPLATELVRATAAKDFNVSEIPVGCSVGICLEPPGTHPTYKELEHRAERALVPDGGKKRRGRICVAPSTPVVPSHSGVSSQPRIELLRAVSLIRSDISTAEVFASPWLNTIAQIAREAAQADPSLSTVSSSVDGLLRWFADVEFHTVLSASSPQDSEHAIPLPTLSTLDVALAVARGVLTAQLPPEPDTVPISLSLRFTFGGSVELNAMPRSRSLWQKVTSGSPENAWECEELGFCFNIYMPAAPTDTGARRAALIKIGHAEFALLARRVFAEVLVVDDRPTRGGQLPDFWEATVARLIALVVRTPGLQFLYVLGDRRFAQETVRRLESADRWPTNLDQMAYKTGLPAHQVAAAAARIGTVRIFPSESDILSRLADDLRTEPVLTETVTAEDLRQPRRFLKRTVDYTGFALGRHDGIRVDTIAEAFPVVLEAARNATSEDVIYDAAGQPLRELMDFKVVLRTPTLDRVPAFYGAESQSLTDYLGRAFLNSDALFGALFRADGQLDAVLAHVSSIIAQRSSFATRRAILVVPHVVRDNEDVSPLGLVSIRIVPRIHGAQVTLLYSFTWRTVEAFVGFPYSLFGSVGFAEYLTSLLCSRVGTGGQRQIRMGEISYIAHSLHMFLDDYGQNIARRIVDDASS